MIYNKTTIIKMIMMRMMITKMHLMIEVCNSNKSRKN